MEEEEDSKATNQLESHEIDFQSDFECEYLGKNILKYGTSLLLYTHTPNCFCTPERGNIELFCFGCEIDFQSEFECEYLGKNILKYGTSLLLYTHTPNCFCTRDRNRTGTTTMVTGF